MCVKNNGIVTETLVCGKSTKRWIINQSKQRKTEFSYYTQ